MTTDKPSVHWLVNAVSRGGIDTALVPPLESGEPIGVAWKEVGSALGIGARELGAAVGKAFRLEVADLKNRDQTAARILTEDLARKFLVLPTRQTDRALFVATANPTDFDAESEIRFISGRDTNFEIAPPDEILTAITETWEADHREAVLLTNKALDAATDAVQIEGGGDSTPRLSDGDDDRGPAVKLANLILFEAARAGARVVLLEPQRNGGRIRIKTDTGMTTLLTLPRSGMGKTVDRIRRLAGFGGSAAVVGDEGNFDAVISGVPYRLRVARTTEGGEERILIHMGETTTSDATVDTDDSAPAGDSRPLVLVVDDDKDARLLVRTILEGSGFRVIEAPDGPPALELLAGPADIALMILDLQMPDMLGLDVVKQVRSTIRTVGLPVVVMTSSENLDDELALFEAGADDYLCKPVHPPRMIVRIRAVLRRSGVHVEH